MLASCLACLVQKRIYGCLSLTIQAFFEGNSVSFWFCRSFVLRNQSHLKKTEKDFYFLQLRFLFGCSDVFLWCKGVKVGVFI